MSTPHDIKDEYQELIKKISEELAEKLLKNEIDLEKKFTSFDSEVHKILMEIGKNTMQIVGNNLTCEVKKKPTNKA